MGGILTFLDHIDVDLLGGFVRLSDTQVDGLVAILYEFFIVVELSGEGASTDNLDLPVFVD